MSFLTTIKHGAQNLDVRHPAKVAGWGLLSHAVETAEYLGGSYLAGRINTQLGDRAKIRGVEATYAGGIVVKILAIVADMFGYGGGLLSHANTLATSFIGAHFAAIGAKHGLEAAGRSASVPALPSAKKDMVGAIPPAPGPGKWLDMSAVDRLAAMHG